jgi:hypothetical protein
MENDVRKMPQLHSREIAFAKARKVQKTNAASQHNSYGQIKEYQRQRDLPCLLPLWPHEIRDETATGARKLIARLQCALRAERQRGRAGHWSYDLNRHLDLVQAYKSEVAALVGRTPISES